MEAYRAGQRVFGESRPQELAAKAAVLPKDIVWQFIGHLQTNKVKMVLPVAAMVESVDSVRLLEAIEKWGAANSSVTEVLLEMHIASEETKQGFSREEILAVVSEAGKYPHVRISGLMGMATLTGDEAVIRGDFARLVAMRDEIREKASGFPGLRCGKSEGFARLNGIYFLILRLDLKKYPNYGRLFSGRYAQGDHASPD